jgi:hypothetical protein
MSFTDLAAPLSKPKRRSLNVARPVLSLERYDHATIEEAKKVLLGTSRWFAFNEAGALQILNGQEIPEQYNAQQDEIALLRDVAARPDHYRAEIKQLRKKKPEKSKHMLEIEEETEKALALVDTPNPLRDEVAALNSQAHSLEGKSNYVEYQRDLAQDVALWRGRLAKLGGLDFTPGTEDTWGPSDPYRYTLKDAPPPPRTEREDIERKIAHYERLWESSAPARRNYRFKEEHNLVSQEDFLTRGPEVMKQLDTQRHAIKRNAKALEQKLEEETGSNASHEQLKEDVSYWDRRAYNLESHFYDQRQAQIKKLKAKLELSKYVTKFDTYFKKLQTMIRGFDPAADDGKEFDISSLAHDLKQATRTFAGDDTRKEMLDAVVQPFLKVTGRAKDSSAHKRKAWFGEAAEFSPGRRQIFGAVLALIAGGIHAHSEEEAREIFNTSVALTAKSKDYRGGLFGEMLDKNDDIQPLLDQRSRALHSTEDHVEQLQKYLDQFHAATEAKGKPGEEELASMDWDERNDKENWWDSEYLMQHSSKMARQLRYNDDYMRFHNVHPEAVNFIRASHEAEFLLGHRGKQRNIQDSASFLASPWMHLLSGVELTVALPLLAAARDRLNGTERTHS